MLTKNDLKAIADTLDPLIKAEREITIKDLKNYIDANNSILGQIIRIDLLAQKKDTMDVMKQVFRRLES